MSDCKHNFTLTEFNRLEWCLAKRYIVRNTILSSIRWDIIDYKKSIIASFTNRFWHKETIYIITENYRWTLYQPQYFADGILSQVIHFRLSDSSCTVVWERVWLSDNFDDPLWWCKYLESFFVKDNNAFILHGYYNCYWYQGHIKTHWGRVTPICVSNLTTIGSDNGLSPGRHQAIIWPNAGMLLIGPLGTNFSEILIVIETFSFKKMHLKISSAKWCPFFLGLSVLTTQGARTSAATQRTLDAKITLLWRQHDVVLTS